MTSKDSLHAPSSCASVLPSALDTSPPASSAAHAGDASSVDAHPDLDDATSPALPTRPLHVVVVGAGLGGLAAAVRCASRGRWPSSRSQHPPRRPSRDCPRGGCGHWRDWRRHPVRQCSRTRLKRRLLPNVTRIFQAWGLLDSLRKTAVEPQTIWFRRWEDGRKIGKTALVPDFEERFGSPYLVAHRAHMHEILHKETLRLGGVVRVNSAVQSVDFDAPSVTLRSGETIEADAVIGADGIKSVTRAQMLGKADDAPVRTGCAGPLVGEADRQLLRLSRPRARRDRPRQPSHRQAHRAAGAERLDRRGSPCAWAPRRLAHAADHVVPRQRRLALQPRPLSPRPQRSRHVAARSVDRRGSDEARVRRLGRGGGRTRRRCQDDDEVAAHDVPSARVLALAVGPVRSARRCTSCDGACATCSSR